MATKLYTISYQNILFYMAKGYLIIGNWLCHGLTATSRKHLSWIRGFVVGQIGMLF